VKITFLDIIPDKVPTMTIGTAGARPVLLFCALASEFKTVTFRLPGGTLKTQPRIPPYYRSYVKTATGRERLVVVLQTGVAGVNAGISATRVLDYFDQPEIAILVGITAGLKDERSFLSKDKAMLLGDVLVPTATVDVETGKVTPKGKEPAGLSIPVSPYHQRAVANWSGYTAWAARWKRPQGDSGVSPRIVTDCTIACTASVIAYAAEAQSLRKESEDSGD
jgi:nucleoside phosphorylase